MSGLIERLKCLCLGHRFAPFCDGLKRRCSRCGAEDWMMSKPYPLVGEPKYYWKRMKWDETW